MDKSLFSGTNRRLFTSYSHQEVATNKSTLETTIMEKQPRLGRNKAKPWGRHQGIRISEDQWLVLSEMVLRSGGKLNKSAFIREAIDEKLERDVTPEQLKEFGYIKSY